jgi:hypothetical protein
MPAPPQYQASTLSLLTVTVISWIVIVLYPSSVQAQSTCTDGLGLEACSCGALYDCISTDTACGCRVKSNKLNDSY